MSKKFYELYEEKRSEKNLTLKEIGEAIDKSTSFINEVLKNRRKFSVTDVYKAVDYLKLNEKEKEKLIFKYLEEEAKDLYNYIKKLIND